MALRATRQYVDVLASGNGKARVTRQYVDVLVKLAYPVVHSESYTDSLGLLVGSGSDLNLGFSDSLATSQAVVVGLDLVREPQDSIGLSQEVTVTSPVRVTVEHSLGFSDSATYSSPVFVELSQSLSPVSSPGKTFAKTESVSQSLALSHSPTWVRDVRRTVSDSLAPSDAITRTIWIDFVDELGLIDEEFKRDTISDSLGLTQAVTWGWGGVTTDTLTFAQTVTPQLDLTRTVADVCGLTQAVAYYVTGRRFDRQYCPSVGETVPGAPTPPATTLTGPLTGITAPFQLVYPATGAVTDSVTLRAPEFGNKDRLAFNRVSRETRGGTQIVYADPMWPKIQTLVLTFTALRQNECQDLLDFVDDYAGMEIGLIDWEKRYWTGVIVSPEISPIEDSFNTYTVSFEFEGELDTTWSPQVIPVTTGTPKRRVSQVYGRVPELEPIPPVEPTTDVYTAESDLATVAGQPLYVKATGHVSLADATTAATAAAVGFATTSVDSGESVNYVTEGKLTLADWTAVAGTATLTPGSRYWLSSTPGQIATTAASDFATQLGRATSTLTLDIEIEAPIGL